MVSLGYTTLQMNVYQNSHTAKSLNNGRVRPYTEGEIPIMDRIDEDLYVISVIIVTVFYFRLLLVVISLIGYSPVLNRVDMNHLVLQGG